MVTAGVQGTLESNGITQASISEIPRALEFGLDKISSYMSPRLLSAHALAKACLDYLNSVLVV